MCDLISTPTEVLCEIASGLKVDAKTLFPINKVEAMRLFRLFRKVTEELYRRERLARIPYSLTYKYN